MARVGRPGLSVEQKRQVWRRWAEGFSLSEIARALGKVPGSIHGVVAANGGFVPPDRQRARQQLTLTEAGGDLARVGQPGVVPVDRGAVGAVGVDGKPGGCPQRRARPVSGGGGADGRAWDRARRPKECLLARDEQLCRLVAGKLAEDWSPEQIAGWLDRTYRRRDGGYVSHETIYRSLFVQARGVLRKELTRHLRTRRTMRHSAHASTAGQARGQIQDAVPISQRPGQDADRAVPGAWEGDLLVGTRASQIATLVERRSRYVMLLRVPSKDAATVATCLTRKIRELPVEMMRSLTRDSDTELAEHKRARPRRLAWHRQHRHTQPPGSRRC